MADRLKRFEVFKVHIKNMFVDGRPNIEEQQWDELWSFLNIAFSLYAFRCAATYYRCLYSGTQVTSAWGRNGKKNYELIMRTVLRFRKGENISDLDLAEPLKEEEEACEKE
jgi:hypothetical protein